MERVFIGYSKLLKPGDNYSINCVLPKKYSINKVHFSHTLTKFNRFPNLNKILTGAKFFKLSKVSLRS